MNIVKNMMNIVKNIFIIIILGMIVVIYVIIRLKNYYYVNLNCIFKYCDVEFIWGKMCFELYIEFGGRCDLIKGIFDCLDICKYV